MPELLSLLLQQREERGGSDDDEAPSAELSLPDRTSDGVDSDDEVKELDAEGRAKGEQEDSVVKAQLRDGDQACLLPGFDAMSLLTSWRWCK